MERDRLGPTRRFLGGPLVKQRVLFRGPPPRTEPRLDAGVMPRRDCVHLLHDPGEGDDPRLTLLAQAAAVVVREGRERAEAAAAVGEVAEPAIEVAQDELARLVIARADELAEHAVALRRRVLRPKLIQVHVVGRDDQVQPKAQVLRCAERLLLPVELLFGQVPEGVGGVGVADIGGGDPVAVAVEAPPLHLGQVGGHLPRPQGFIRVAEVRRAIALAQREPRGALGGCPCAGGLRAQGGNAGGLEEVASVHVGGCIHQVSRGA